MVERNMDAEQVHITYSEYDTLLRKLESKIKAYMRKHMVKPLYVHGPARGGVPIAVHLSHHLGLKYSPFPTDNMLLVDDINDSGRTISKIRSKYYVPITAVLFEKKQSCVRAECYVKPAKNTSWYIFPWEKK